MSSPVLPVPRPPGAAPAEAVAPPGRWPRGTRPAPQLGRKLCHLRGGLRAGGTPGDEVLVNRIGRARAPERFAQALDRWISALGLHGVGVLGDLVVCDACACHIVYPLLYCVYDTVHYTEYTTIHKQYAKHLHIVTNKAQKSPLGGG